jgi:hypothetical protein
MKRLLIGTVMLGGVLFVAGYVWVIAQNGASQKGSSQTGGSQSAGKNSQASQDDQDISMLRKDIRVQKRHIIETKVPLTDAEAQKFWPVYDQYTAALVDLNNVKYGLIKSYTESYDTMTDAEADEWSTRMLKLDEDVAALREKYWASFRKVLPAKKAALYEQVERRTQMVIDVQLASQFPLVQPKREQ